MWTDSRVLLGSNAAEGRRVHRKRMQEKTVLYLGEGGAKQHNLRDHLGSLKLNLHQESSVTIAKQRLCEQEYHLLLIQFEHIREHVFNFCAAIRHQGNDHSILVLMEEADAVIESKLFEYGVDDVAAGRQTHPTALKARIIKRLFNSRLSLPNTNQVKLKGGVSIDFERKEVYHNGHHRRLKGLSEKLLHYFLENPHRTITRQELINSHLWDNSVCRPDKVEGGKAVDMAVIRLRRTIESDTSRPQIILTVHGTGWILAKDAIH